MSETKEPEHKIIPTPNLAMTNRGFEPTTIEEAWRFAEALSQSNMVPDVYRNKPRDCLIALDLAGRLRVSWLAVMQNVYSVHGRIGIMATLCISLINSSELFTDPLDYEEVGSDPEKTDYKVRAIAKRKKTGKVLCGPWINWKLVKAEGWDKKNGSKWLTMPGQMFHYRAASWFANLHCPEVKMGMMTVEEVEELPSVKHIDSVTFDEAQAQTAETIEKEQGSEEIKTNFEPNVDEDRDPEIQAKIDQQKRDLQKDIETPAKKRGRPKKNNNPKNIKPIYHCDNCNRDFDKVNAEDKAKGWQCPHCMCWRVIKNTQEPVPAFLED